MYLLYGLALTGRKNYNDPTSALFTEEQYQEFIIRYLKLLFSLYSVVLQ